MESMSPLKGPKPTVAPAGPPSKSSKPEGDPFGTIPNVNHLPVKPSKSASIDDPEKRVESNLKGPLSKVTSPLVKEAIEGAKQQTNQVYVAMLAAVIQIQPPT